MKVKVTAVVVVLTLGAAGSSFAQQREMNQERADQQQSAQKIQLQTFELVLRQAVDRGGQELAAWADHIAPGVMLAPVSQTLVSSVPVPNVGVVFDVQIPEIIGTQFVQKFARPTTVPAQQQGGLQQTGGRQGVSANNLPTADPMKTDPVAAENISPDRRYSELVRQALIDAILDRSSGVLSLKDNETLTVAAMGIDVAVTNPLYKNQSRKLILHVKGADLNLYHAGKISKEEAQSRMIEMRF